MPKTLPFRLFCCLFLALNAKSGLAQASIDTSTYQQSVLSLINRFNENIGEGARLFNGFVYNGYAPNIQGNAYLDDITTPQNGTVDYDGQIFENVRMLYDIYADRLVVLLDVYAAPCRLVSDKVASFDLHHSHFIRVADAGMGIKTGFYDELYGGRSQVLNRPEKTLITSSKQSGIEHYFMPVQNYHQFFIRKDNKYYSIVDMNDAIAIFKDKKNELKKFIKDKHIQFNILPEYSLVAVATEYDRLTK